MDYIRARWRHIFSPPAVPAQPDEHRALLLQNQAELRNIFLVGIATLAAVLLMLVNKSHTESMASSGSNRSGNIPTEDDTGHGPATTSRTSVQKVFSMVSTFCQFKKFLVQQIGFGGFLNFPCLARLNLRFSKWIMSKIDPDNRSICLDHKRNIRFWSPNVHKVFGIPCGNRDISAPDSRCSDTTIQFIKSALGMLDKGKSVLKAVEEILSRPLSEASSSNLEKDCFKMAFVIFVMGHILSPLSKHEHCIIDYRGALANTDHICDFNWGEYVLQDIFKAVAKLKIDIQKESTITHLEGCHLFAQVFYLDNMNLGIFNMRHDILPRISCFDDVKMRRMILQCSSPLKGVEDFSSAMIRDAKQIYYTRSMWDRKPDTMTPGNSSVRRNEPREKNIATGFVPNLPESQTAPRPNMLNVPTLAVRHIHTANDFASYMKDNYPLLASNDVGIMLKHHNAVGFQLANSIKNQIHKENTRFLDKFVAVMADTCICCSLRSLPCIAQNKCHDMPVSSNRYRRSRDFTESEGESSFSSKRKKDFDGEGTALDFSDQTRVSKNQMPPGSSTISPTYEPPPPPPPQMKPCTVRSPADSMKTWADTIVGGIMMYNEDSHTPQNAVLIGQQGEESPAKHHLKHTHYGKDHWTSGTVLDYPTIAVQDKLVVLLTRFAPFYQFRNCVTHCSPRYISMPASSLTGQLIGHDLLEHELCSLLFRRLRQIDIQVLYKDAYGVWRHLFEVDFSTSVLAGEKVWELKSVQDQFTGPDMTYNICLCRLFHVPVIHETGWCLYTWDMMKKIIYIFDPLNVGHIDPANEAYHELVADKLHVALFTCLYKFFLDWHVDCINWKKKFPFVTSTKFSKNETGICILHIARHFNTLSLGDQLSDDAIIREKGFLLFHLMRLEGNSAPIPTGIKDLISNA